MRDIKKSDEFLQVFYKENDSELRPYASAYLNKRTNELFTKEEYQLAMDKLSTERILNIDTLSIRQILDFLRKHDLYFTFSNWVYAEGHEKEYTDKLIKHGFECKFVELERQVENDLTYVFYIGTRMFALNGCYDSWSGGHVDELSDMYLVQPVQKTYTTYEAVE